MLSLTDNIVNRLSFITQIENITREAGALALDIFKRDYKIWRKKDNSPVSEADFAVDKFLYQNLMEKWPNDGWLSEESEPSANWQEAGFTWIIDPIDGTSSFIRGSAGWCISLALVHKGRPVIGVIYSPASDLFFSASLGKGAYLNGQRINVSKCLNLREAKILTSAKTVASKQWKTPLPPIHIAKQSALALRLSLVACSRFDGAITSSPAHDWDIAAGDLILTEAQGQFTGIDGNVFLYNGKLPKKGPFIAAGQTIHHQLISHAHGTV